MGNLSLDKYSEIFFFLFRGNYECVRFKILDLRF